ncbi:hypothetical protein KIN20_018234 [Parelaphostrongylus tenuis]|uniref:Uncharacterized protein n=1 Tax=Parelaphostrongylus tenuis TaxID=148309 RepID=A0AAD5N0U7_PARTN|nr:hypothetical protein KIN20_018234 [Parelaphostrongylus tenuis]
MVFWKLLDSKQTISDGVYDEQPEHNIMVTICSWLGDLLTNHGEGDDDRLGRQIIPTNLAHQHEFCMMLTEILLKKGVGLNSALRCRHCNGWNGAYPLRNVIFPNCDNENNQCQTKFFCVKIVDPISAGAGYSTYKGDCWMTDEIQLSVTNRTTVQNGHCYNYEDDAIPSDRFKYCFCNDTDYCNSAGHPHFHIALFFSTVSLSHFLQYLHLI